MEKLQKLKDWFASHGNVAVAFSGGVDSAFLLHVAHGTLLPLGGRAAALFVVSELTPRSERERAERFCAERGILLRTVPFDALSLDRVRENPPDRCYHCKKAMFSRIFEETALLAGSAPTPCVVDGSNADDAGDYRPGLKALQELGVLSPLKELGFTKAEIRSCSREAGLFTWDVPSAACLASRISYGEELTAEKLRRVDGAEDAIRSLGFGQCRVRVHGSLARIELLPSEMARALDAREEIVRTLTALGFDYVSLDLRGYRTGAMNETLRGGRDGRDGRDGAAAKGSEA